jgi:replicative DNA helicase
LLLGFAEAAAARGHRVLFFGLEMGATELGARRLVSYAGVSLSGLQSWRSQERERVLAELSRAREILTRPLDFAGPSTRSFGQIRAACRRQRQRHGLDLVCVDYLGLVTHEKAGKASLYERTTLVSQALKALAMDLGVPLLCAVQLNREPASQNGKPARPALAHFRDSGAIEQDCDIALLIHQDGTRDAIEDGDCELLLAKQRNGWHGSVPLRWRAACARFESPAEPNCE